ncbi:family 2A encapsulin nanocompartment cargo protein cysteine desulfurase [Leptospira barantonii]|uniref:Cysteine desulfurase n=1 Tax=Leptospira barantonii TaxID=2023184 RepID=A0ABX4NTG1_9LEPT|nr:family 2A encapsulin nanocompartment cargo protein cysteine desulfurase [Leptospira barantonii]PJZ58308.1 cysteine desulfurase [Leptospira barantonii]
MSTSDPLSWVPKDLPSSGQKELQGFIDPSVIASMAGELFGSLPKGGSVEELILSDSSVTESKSLVQKTAPVKSGSILENSYGLNLSESELSRIPDGILSGSNLPSFPGGLTSKNVGIGAQPFSTSFSFLEDIRSFVPDVPGSQSIESFGFSPSLIPKVNLSSGGLDIASLKKDFPILKEKINGRELVWLDNAATTQKPQSVIDRISEFYEHENSNIHRGAHTLAARATDAYEAAREKTSRFLNASSTNEIVFVRGATEAINLVAQTWGKQNIGKNDEIIISWLEHHANIVPWQMLCSEKGARLKVIPVDETGQIILSEYERLLSPRTKLVSITQVSNALGTVTPLVPIIEQAHKFGAKVLVDGAQAVSHIPIDVQALDCDFYVFSGHKVFAPTGIGVLFGKSDVLETIPPWQGGGNMIEDVTFEKTVYQPAPFRFEAGTGNIADAVGLGAAIDYLDQIGMKNIADYEHSLLEYGTEQLQRIPSLRLIGTSKDKAGVLSFVLEGFKTEDVGRFLNQEGIAVRSGHHCAQPILRRFGLENTVRPSLALYNTCDDIDALVSALFDLRGGRTSGPL